jgi:hypothetical protein
MDDQPASVTSELNEDLLELARSLTEVFTSLRQLAPNNGTSDFVARLQDHLGVDPRGLPVLSQELPSYQLVDLQVGLEVWTVASEGRTVDVFGISGDQRRSILRC